MPKYSKKRRVSRDAIILAERLEFFRLEKSLTYRQLAASIGGIAPESARRACLGCQLSLRLLAKIKTFLSSVEGANRAA